MSTPTPPINPTQSAPIVDPLYAPAVPAVNTTTPKVEVDTPPPTPPAQTVNVRVGWSMLDPRNWAILALIAVLAALGGWFGHKVWQGHQKSVEVAVATETCTGELPCNLATSRLVVYQNVKDMPHMSFTVCEKR